MKRFEDYDSWTKELLDQGLSYSEIGKIQNRSRHSVRAHCEVRGWLREKKTNEVRREMAIERMREQFDLKGFELIDNIGGADGIVHIKCKTCGEVVEKDAQCARHGKTLPCSNCLRIEKERKAKEEEQAKAARQWIAEREKAKRIVYKQQSFFICHECGGMFYGKQRKYCSDKCAQRVTSRNADFKRRVRTKSQIVDRDITLKALYERDNGVCYICGEKCDWNDYYYKGNVFIAGDKYPSIEHVIPLSKNGKHSWANVKLSCRKCNYLKSDSLPECQEVSNGA